MGDEQHFEIKSIVGNLLFACEAESLAHAIRKAYLSRAYLTGAYLSGADLTGAYLSGAYLSGADLSG